jgi:uncharacterized phage protein (TIGR01671 family)
MEQREIIFRGKRIDNSEWVEGSLMQLLNGDRYIKGNDTQKRFGCGIQIIPSTVGQFTGLTNKNGVRIFEGDKVKFISTKNFYDNTNGKKSERIAPVYWNKYRMTFAVQVTQSVNSNLYEFVQDGNNIEVIGNIHEA